MTLHFDFWATVGTVGNSAFPLGRSFQWELRSRCQKSKGTEFPCVSAAIKPWLASARAEVCTVIESCGQLACLGSHAELVYMCVRASVLLVTVTFIFDEIFRAHYKRVISIFFW